MKIKELQEWIILVLIIYLLYNIFSKCPNIRLFEGFVIPPTINLSGIQSNANNRTVPRDDEEDEEDEDDESDNSHSVLDLIKDIFISIFTNIQLLIGVGSIIIIIIVSVVLYRVYKNKGKINIETAKNITEGMTNNIKETMGKAKELTKDMTKNMKETIGKLPEKILKR